MEFANFIKSHRMKLFRFPKTFFSEGELSCGYVHYLEIEKGRKIPTAKVAAEILEALDADIKKGLLAWARDQFDEKKYKALFLPSLHLLSSERKQVSAKKALTVNRMQLKLLERDPIYWDLTVYLSVFSHVENRRTLPAIANSFKKSAKDLTPILEELYEYGFINKETNELYSTKEWVFIPDEEEYTKIRDGNFEHAYKRFAKEDPQKRFRTVHNRTVTDEQQDLIVQNILSLLDSITDLPDKTNGRAFSIGIFTNNRSFEPL